MSSVHLCTPMVSCADTVHSEMPSFSAISRPQKSHVGFLHHIIDIALRRKLAPQPRAEHPPVRQHLFGKPTKFFGVAGGHVGKRERGRRFFRLRPVCFFNKSKKVPRCRGCISRLPGSGVPPNLSTQVNRKIGRAGTETGFPLCPLFPAFLFPLSSGLTADYADRADKAPRQRMNAPT